MPTTQFQTINCDSRNTLIRNRDEIMSKFGVSMRFPKNLVRGGFQDMVLEGGAQAIFNAQKEINRILVIWQDEYDAFLERKSKRTLYQRRERHFNKAQELERWPEIPDTTRRTETTAPTKNAFAALALDEGEVPPVENFPTLGETKHVDGTMLPIMENKSVLTGWSKIAAKPAAEGNTTRPVVDDVNARITFTENKAFTWGDEESEDEEVCEGSFDGTANEEWPSL